MAYAEFLARVRECGGYDDSAEAARITEAVLVALGSRMQPQEAAELGEQLPEELAEMLTADTGTGADWAVHEFVHHVAESTQSDYEDARTHAQSVLSVIGETVSGDELTTILSGLPAAYAELFAYPELA
jgi:uncharacterized protein (DUF2267 family)